MGRERIVWFGWQKGEDLSCSCAHWIPSPFPSSELPPIFSQPYTSEIAGTSIRRAIDDQAAY